MAEWQSSAERRATRKLMREIAQGQGNVVRQAFDQSLAGDVARFRLLRKLRKLYPLSTCERLIFEEATAR